MSVPDIDREELKALQAMEAEAFDLMRRVNERWLEIRRVLDAGRTRTAVAAPPFGTRCARLLADGPSVLLELSIGGIFDRHGDRWISIDCLPSGLPFARHCTASVA